MTLLDAREDDPVRARKRKRRIVAVVVLVVVVLGVGVLGFLLGHGWWFSYWPDERRVGHFFELLQKQDFKAAYGVWMNDPDWPSHLDRDRIKKYPFNDFYRDWGPGGDWGTIKTERVFGASGCPGGGSGIVVDVVVNDRAEHAQVWYEKSDHTLGFPPVTCQLVFR